MKDTIITFDPPVKVSLFDMVTIQRSFGEALRRAIVQEREGIASDVGHAAIEAAYARGCTPADAQAIGLAVRGAVLSRREQDEVKI